MKPEKWQHVMYLLTFFLFSNVSGAFVGVNIGTDISNLPSASDVVSVLQAQGINHVRLFDADHQMLSALANTGIDVIVGVPNDQLLRIGESRSEAANWINQNVVPFVPATNITYISLGSEVLTTIPNAALVLVPAMQFIQAALVAADLNFRVKVSSPHSMDIIPKSFPPSMASFNSTWSSVMIHLLQFLKNTGSPLMLNAYPYYGYTQVDGLFPLNYALFESLAPNKQIVDPNTLDSYHNMLYAMIDAAYYSIKALNFSGIEILVTETGWPWRGGDNETAATVDNALVYNNNLMRHVLDGSGTPSQPNISVNTYIYELFNEDLRPGPISEKNWGLFFPNRSAVYSLSFGNVAELEANTSGMSGVFCVAKATADQKSLKAGLDWACGPGSANCTAIQPGQPCYVSNNLVAIASYAYNDYYQRTKVSGGSCSFGDTAMTTTTDPSHGSCKFAGSTGSKTSNTSIFSLSPTASAPISPIDGASSLQVSGLAYLTPLLLLALV